MANEYATNDDLKDYLGISDTDQDATLDIILEAASRAIDDYCDRHFYAEDDASARLYTAESRFVYVDDISETDSLAVLADHGYDGTFEQTWTVDDYDGSFGFRLFPYNALDKSQPVERLEAISSYWPSGRSAIQVTAKWGWPAVPAVVKGVTLQFAHAEWLAPGILERNSGSPGVSALSLEGSDSVDYESAADAIEEAKGLVEAAKGKLNRYKKRRLL